MPLPGSAAARLRGLAVSALLFGALFGVAPPLLAQTIVLSNNRALSFGRFAAGGGGTVTVTPAGVRSRTGSVILMNSPSVTSASFVVTKSKNGNPALAIVITLPANNALQLTSGANSMALNNFVCSPTTIASIPNNGAVVLTVGATMTVASKQAPGSYSGSFPVTVNYQ
jgi:hypothetical protein